MAADTSDTLLPAVHLSFHTAFLPLHSYLFGIRQTGYPEGEAADMIPYRDKGRKGTSVPACLL